MNEIEISDMTLLDLDSISNILTTDFDDFWTINIFKLELNNPNSKYIIAKHNRNIVGFAGIWKSLSIFHITNIAVRKDMRRNGIGELLLKRLIILSEAAESLTLEVKESNLAAQKLYEKYNFKKIGIRKNYYNNIENAIIMTLNLL